MDKAYQTYTKGLQNEESGKLELIQDVGASAANAFQSGLMSQLAGKAVTSAALSDAAYGGLSGAAAADLSSTAYKGTKSLMKKFKPTRKVLRSKAFRTYIDPALSYGIPMAAGVAATFAPPPVQAGIIGASVAKNAGKIALGKYRQKKAIRKAKRIQKRAYYGYE